MAYRQAGEAGLVDTRMLRGKASAVDPRWDEAVRLVLAELVGESTPTRSAVLRKVAAQLDDLHGAGVVPQPSPATAYRRLAELARGTNAVSGSAKGRRSIADRPQGAYGRLRAMRPGEYAILDTQDLDVFAMEPVTCRWVRAQLTVAQDLFTRCITGLRVTPVSTKAVDVAGVLYQAIVPQPAPEEAGGGVLGLITGCRSSWCSPNRGCCPGECQILCARVFSPSGSGCLSGTFISHYLEFYCPVYSPVSRNRHTLPRLGGYCVFVFPGGSGTSAA